MNKHAFHHRQAGNTLAEYGIIAALISVAGMASLVAMGGSLQRGFDGMSQGLGAAKPMTLTHAPVHFGPKIAPLTLSPALSSAAPMPAIRPMTPVVPISVNPNEGMQGQVQTLGANGATQVLSTRLEVLAKQLLADGEITPAQSDSILRLANQGHLMARAEAALENLATIAPDKQTFTHTPLNVDGKNYNSAWNLMDQLGYNNQTMNTITDPLAIPPYQKQGTLSTTFLNLYQEVVNSGAANNPQAAGIIQDAASQIMMLSEFLNHSVTEVYQGGVKPAAIQSDLVSQSTDLHATTVCTTGSYKNTGGLCH